jgi:signal transduction histidine kinase
MLRNTAFKRYALSHYQIGFNNVSIGTWVSCKLNAQLKVHDKMQREFINVAAHELRNPIQPILCLSQVLRSKKEDTGIQERLLDLIIRNAKRLQKLTEDILDVTRIGSQSLHLNKEQFKVGEIY